MPLPAEVAAVLPEATVAAWSKVAVAVPDDAILMGGTALAVHLHHRISRDLDLFTTERFDVDAVAGALARQGEFAPTLRSEGTLNGVLDGTKVQVLWARGQRVLEPTEELDGMKVGSLPDLLAMKVKVIGDRGELRDYFDIKAIEEQAGLSVEEGLVLYLRRYQLDDDHPSLRAIVTGLGFFDDVVGDPHLTDEHGPEIFDEVRAYWQRRQVEIVASLDRWADSPPR